MFLFSTDIDGTIYDGPESAALFARFWQELSEQFDQPPVLAYNTGRAITDTRELVRTTELPKPDWFICGVGTEIFDAEAEELLQPWIDWLSEGWDYDTVHEIVANCSPAELQPSASQSALKCSWYWHGAADDEIQALEQQVRDAGMDAQAVYSSSRDLDLLPARANKGNAVAFLAKQLGIPLDRVIVAGDSGNDASMYLVDGVRGVVVANAEESLKESVADLPVFFSESACVAGAIEGINHHRDNGLLKSNRSAEESLS